MYKLVNNDLVKNAIRYIYIITSRRQINITSAFSTSKPEKNTFRVKSSDSMFFLLSLTSIVN